MSIARPPCCYVPLRASCACLGDRNLVDAHGSHSAFARAAATATLDWARLQNCRWSRRIGIGAQPVLAMDLKLPHRALRRYFHEIARPPVCSPTVGGGPLVVANRSD